MKFGFLAVLYLFLLWIARSARRDLRAGAGGWNATRPEQARAEASIPPDATGMYSASALGSADLAHRSPRLVSSARPGTTRG